MSTRRNRTTAKGFKNKRMDDKVYAERRIVMNHIYKAKNLLRKNGMDMARVDVRIASREEGETAVGKARMRDNIIWMPEDYLNSRFTYQVVLHELCHALWGIEHDKKCKLMHPNVQVTLSNAKAEDAFLNYASKQPVRDTRNVSQETSQFLHNLQFQRTFG